MPRTSADFDRQATSGRATRRKHRRVRQAANLVAHTAWLHGAVVCWTGEPERTVRCEHGPLPLRTVLQDRLADLPAGLYAVRIDLPAALPPGAGRRRREPRTGSADGALQLRVTAVDEITPARIADAARAIEAATKFPNVAARLVGPVDSWCAAMRRRLAVRRAAAEAVNASRAGRRDIVPAGPPVLWIGAGAPAAHVPPAATLTDAMLKAAWADERSLDASPVTADETAGVQRLLAALAAVRREPARRHDVMRRLATQHLQLCRAPSGFRHAGDPDQVRAQFRGLVIDEVYGTVRRAAEAAWPTLPDSVFALAECWIGEGFFGRQTYAYADAVLSHASLALGNPHEEICERSPRNLTDDVPAGSPLDPAGAAALVAAANRLRWTGAPGACEALAAWVEACRPLVPLAAFWRDVLAFVPAPGLALDADRARRLVASLQDHGTRIAGELVLGPGEHDRARALLPAVLARGPDATDRAMRRGLWVEDERDLDAALRFVEEAERAPGDDDPGETIPMPRCVFTCKDPVLRDAILAFALAAWAGRAIDAGAITLLADMIQTAAERPGAASWSTALPLLHSEGTLLLRRAERTRRPGDVALSADTAAVAFVILDVCACWLDAGFTEPRRVARVLSSRWRSGEQAAIEWDPDHDDHNRLLARLSEGRLPRFLALLRQPRAPRRQAWRGIDGWRMLERHPVARAWLSAALDRADLAGRVLRLLERIGLMARLDPGLRAARVFAPLDRAPDQEPRWPSWVQPEDAAMLAQIHRASAVAGVPGGIPNALQRLLDRETTMARERRALGARDGRRHLAPAAQARAARLDDLAADHDAFEADLRRSLRKALPRQMAQAGLAALEAIAGRDLDRRWREVIGGGGVAPDSPAWENALLMLETVTHNRRVLRRLLRHAALGDRAWVRDLDPNRAFLDRLRSAGVDADAWLADASRIVQAGGRVFTAYAATDPLEVLQMGSLFGTCLSADRFNAHAAVAAAVEVNKRVLYVRDGSGRVLGRQLLAMTASGEVIGFTCYGAGLDDRRQTGQWVKIALSLLALDLARASGARLMTAERAAQGLSAEKERALTLFSKGYVDTPESFDWWIEALGSEDPLSGEHDRARLRSLLEMPVPDSRNARTAPDWRREELGREACRALIWLGDDAPGLSAAQEQALGLGPRHRHVQAGGE